MIKKHNVTILQANAFTLSKNRNHSIIVTHIKNMQALFYRYMLITFKKILQVK